MPQLYQLDGQEPTNVIPQLDVAYLLRPVFDLGPALLLADAGEPTCQLGNALEPVVATQAPGKTHLLVIQRLPLVIALAAAEHDLPETFDRIPIFFERRRCSLCALTDQLADVLLRWLVCVLLVDDGLEFLEQLLYAQGSSIGIPTGLIGQPVECWGASRRRRGWRSPR